jgi:predicted transcriptional regulator
MRTENVQYFTDAEEQLIDLLVKIGTKKTVAKVLVFMVDTRKATIAEIEHGADLRQPEISMAMKYLIEREWVSSREIRTSTQGRPMKIYELVKPTTEILEIVQAEKRDEVKNQLELIRKLRDYL